MATCYDPVKRDAQAIYRADSYAEAVEAFRHFRAQWQSAYPAMVRCLDNDLPELLTFFRFPRPLGQKLRTTNVIERCFVEGDGAPDPWSALSMSRAWIALFSRSLTASMKIGETVPFAFLHKQLDITGAKKLLTFWGPCARL